MNDKQGTSQIYNVDTPFSKIYSVSFRIWGRGRWGYWRLFICFGGIRRLNQGQCKLDIERAMGLHHTQHVAFLNKFIWLVRYAFCWIHLRPFAYLNFCIYLAFPFVGLFAWLMSFSSFFSFLLPGVFSFSEQGDISPGGCLPPQLPT